MIGIHYLEKWERVLSKRALKKVLYLKEVLLLYSSKVFFFFLILDGSLTFRSYQITKVLKRTTNLIMSIKITFDYYMNFKFSCHPRYFWLPYNLNTFYRDLSSSTFKSSN